MSVEIQTWILSAPFVKQFQHLMIGIQALEINGREVRDKYKLNLDIPKWNQKLLAIKTSRY